MAQSSSRWLRAHGYSTSLVARSIDSGASWLLRALGLAFLLGILLLLLASPLLPLVTQWMNASAEATPHARDYLQRNANPIVRFHQLQWFQKPCCPQYL